MKKLLGNAEKYTNKACFAALCVMVAYATLFGTADLSRWLGGMNLWSAATLIMLLCAVPGMLMHLKRIVKNPFMWILIAFGLWNVVCLAVGIRNGNQMGKILGDVKSIIYFVMLPALLYVIDDKKKVHILMNIAVVASILLGVFTCVFLWCYAIDRTYLGPVTNFCLDSSYLNLTYVSSKIPRILFVSAPYQLYGCAFSVYFLANKAKKRWPYIFACSISLFSFIITFTRALYLATAVAALLAVMLMIYSYQNQWKRTLRGVAVSAVGCIAILVCFSLMAGTNYFGFALQRVFVSAEETIPPEATDPITNPGFDPVTDPSIDPDSDPATEPNAEDKYLNATAVSDGIRAKIKRQMLEILREDPVFGNGLGTVLPNRRTAPEYSYLDVAIKSGWVGLALYLMPIVLMVFFLVRDLLRKRNMSLSCIWISALAGQMTYAIFQPYIYSGMSILLYCGTLAVCALEHEKVDSNR